MGEKLKNRPTSLALAAAACLTLVVLASRRVAAQGCAMCYQTAAAASAPGRDALRHGILILLVPAVSLFFGIVGFIYRRRNIAR